MNEDDIKAWEDGYATNLQTLAAELKSAELRYKRAKHEYEVMEDKLKIVRHARQKRGRKRDHEDGFIPNERHN